MKHCLAIAVSALWVVRSAPAADPDELLFHLPCDKAAVAAVAAGKRLAQTDLTQVDGKYGKATRFGKAGVLRYATMGNLDRRRGTVCMWVRPNWDAEESTSHALFADGRDFKPANNSLLLWEWHTGLMRFDVRDPKDTYLVCSMREWRRGQWRHVAAAWDCAVGSWLFVDGDLVATKKFTWEPKESETFQFGARQGRAWPADADFDDIRIYGQSLTVGQVRRAMAGRKLQRVRYRSLRLPQEVTPGKAFDAELCFEAPEPLDAGHAAALSMGDLLIATQPLGREATARDGTTTRVVMRATIPAYLYPAPGKHSMSVRIAGTFERDGSQAQGEVLVRLPKRRPAPPLRRMAHIPALPGDGGLLVEGEFFTGDSAQRKAEALVRSARIIDAVPCRKVDEVQCSRTDHAYWENSPATVRELAPGRKFRCVGPQESVTQVKTLHGREHKALAAFSYRLKVMPRPTPHFVVVESINDAERYLEVAIDHPRDSKPAPHLGTSGCGQRVAIHLGVTYSGREYSTDGKPFRQTFMIFPKTDAVEVMISGTKRARFPDARPAAVARIGVYEMLGPLAEFENPITLPPNQPQRSASIFFPAIANIFEKYGFANTSPEARGSTLRLFVDYMRFLGLNRFELRPFQLGTKAYFKAGRFEQASDLDFFAEALPMMQEAGIDVVPRVMYLHCYHKLLEDDKENCQHSADGTIQSFGREGPIPDPLRPPVQKVVLDSIQAMLEACEGYKNVPAVGFDTSIGGLYWNRSAPTSHTGYSQWNVAQFAKDTGAALPKGLDTPRSRFEWIQANAWPQWIDWRCRKWHALCTRIRDMARAKGKKLELSVRIMPREEFWTEGVPIKEIYRYTGYDPDLFRHETDIQMDYFIRVNSDRYFGRPWWKPWFYDPRQPGLFQSKEPRHVEMYYNYWEIPRHPWGFRVGPGSPVGRNFFEPLTYSLRTLNPHDVTFFNWFRATIGREFEVREFCRAFRALPAVDPRDFDGSIEAEPMDERLWVKWFGDRLAVVNDAGYERDVTLSIPLAEPNDVSVVDAAFNHPIETRTQRRTLSVRLSLRQFDLRTLVFVRQAEGGL